MDVLVVGYRTRHSDDSDIDRNSRRKLNFAPRKRVQAKLAIDCDFANCAAVLDIDKDANVQAGGMRSNTVPS